MIAELAVKYRLPSICARIDYVDNGCLMACGPGYAKKAVTERAASTRS